jgi:LysM repeat protein
VKSGESLGKVASKYHVSTKNLMAWNHLKSSNLKIGQKLRVNAPGKTVMNEDVASKEGAGNVKTAPQQKTFSPNARYHVVKKGESLGKVASKYHVTTKNLVAWNKLKSQKLQAGQKLRVNAPGKILNNEDVADNEEKPAVNQTHSKPFSTNAKYHIVKKGEFLNKIATAYGVTSDDLLAWNSLENSNLIVGQKLRVNAPDSGNNTKTAVHTNTQKENTSPSGDDSKMVYYTVKPGDTLWSISQKYNGVTIDQLKKWNQITGKGGIKVGQKIKVLLPSA